MQRLPFFQTDVLRPRDARDPRDQSDPHDQSDAPEPRHDPNARRRASGSRKATAPRPSAARLLSCIARAAVVLAACSLPGAALAAPLISEVFYDAVGSDDTLSFVELYATPGLDLTGLSLEGVNGSNGAVGPVITLSGVVPADGIFVVADRDSAGATQVAGADLLANFDFQNGPDSIVLRGATGILDALGYGVFGASDIFAGEGNAAPDAPAGSSLARLFANVDIGDNLIDFHVLASPTPGTAPLAVPEPSTAALLGAGLAGLARIGRKRAQSRSVIPSAA